jgi:PE-PPE domain
MRKTAHAFGLVVLAFVSSIVLGVASAFMAAFALGAATALIVPGTGTPNANVVANYREHAADRYIAPFEPCSTANGCNLVGVNYPASFWPLGFIGNWCPGFQCDTWNESVGTGVKNLDTALRAELAKPCPTTGCEPIILFGYSQGGAVVSDEMRNLSDLTPEQRARLSVVMIGNAYNPDGGIFTRLGFLPTIPILDVTFGPATPVNTGIPMTGIGFQYDPVMYAPLYWGNPFAMLNALAAFQTVHGFYLTPNGNGPTDPIAYGYTEAELATILAGPCPGPNCRVDSYGNKYYMIPAKSLPLTDFVTSMLPGPLQAFAKPVVDLVSPVLKVLIDLGYDWSGDPGQTRFLSPLPFNPVQNWPAVGANLVAATAQGIQAFFGDLGGLTGVSPTTIVPAAPAPAPTTTTVSTLAAPNSTGTPGAVDVAKNLAAAALPQSSSNVNEPNVPTVQKTDPDTKGIASPTSTTETTVTDDNAAKLDNTTNKDGTKKGSPKGSASLNFSPKKKQVVNDGPGATLGQNGATSSAAPATGGLEPAAA